jgi:hypothetical protein
MERGREGGREGEREKSGILELKTIWQTYTVEGNRTCSSDLEFSVNNLWHLAVTCVNIGRSAAVKVLKHHCWGNYFID